MILLGMMKAVIQSGLAMLSAAQMTSFLQIAVIVGLEMLCANTAKMWQSPVVSVSIWLAILIQLMHSADFLHDDNSSNHNINLILCSIKP